MRVSALIIGFVTVAACNHGQNMAKSKTSNSLPEATMTSRRNEAVGSGDIQRRGDSSEDLSELNPKCKEFLAGIGMRVALSPADDELTSLVMAHMEKAKLPIPQNHRFLISSRDGHWAVCVVDLGALCRGERPRFDTYHVGEREGKLRILFVSAGI